MTLKSDQQAHERIIDDVCHLADQHTDNAFYVQAFVVAIDGEPASVWRWDASQMRYVESTRSELAAELTRDEE